MFWIVRDIGCLVHPGMHPCIGMVTTSGRRIMVITPASQAGDDGSIPFARSINPAKLTMLFWRCTLSWGGIDI